MDLKYNNQQGGIRNNFKGKQFNIFKNLQLLRKLKIVRRISAVLNKLEKNPDVPKSLTNFRKVWRNLHQFIQIINVRNFRKNNEF